jgi:proliferating cell nuclear antigen
MFKITIADSETFKKQIKVISEIITEGKLKIHKDSFGLIAMDASNVVLVDYDVLSSYCTEYKADNEDEFAINFNTFYKTLKTASSNSVVVLSKEDNKLILELKSETDRIFKLPILDIDEKDTKKPDLKHTCKIKVDSNTFKKEIEASDIVAESVSFITKDDKFTIKAEGDMSEFKCDFRELEIKTDKKTEIKSKYSIEYLKKIMEASAFCDNLEIDYSKDNPAQFIFNQPDKFKLDFTIAPRVSD